MLPNDAGQTLLPIARDAIAAAWGQTATTQEDALWLQEPGASFVTLTQHGNLRGCIGSLQARRTLLADVKANAWAAAFHDTRFAPLTQAELADTAVEVSVLSAMQSLDFASQADALAQLRPHIDGIVLECRNHRATFLPQVWEQLPDPASFMAHLKRKAGLPTDFWSPDVQLQRYSVRKWSEDSP
jgi:AmmeMemoRadiSam system protein A